MIYKLSRHYYVIVFILFFTIPKLTILSDFQRHVPEDSNNISPVVQDAALLRRR